MSSVSDSFDDSVPQPESTHSFEAHHQHNGGYNSEQFDSFSGGGNDDAFESHAAADGDEFAPEENGNEIGRGDGPIWGSPMEMEPEEGLALREWRRENAKILEEKEKREKELLSQIIEEADQFKVEFYKKREISCENKKATNREKEKDFVANQEKFHAEADKSYWKAIADLIPKEVPAIETKRGKKDQEKKPGIVVIQGPKPGKPTDLSRMRQILIKLKHNTPPHLKHSPPPPPPEAPAKDAKPNGDASAATSSVNAAVTAPEATVAA